VVSWKIIYIQTCQSGFGPLTSNPHFQPFCWIPEIMDIISFRFKNHLNMSEKIPLKMEAKCGEPQHIPNTVKY
jgi:hypothetical protein